MKEKCSANKARMGGTVLLLMLSALTFSQAVVVIPNCNQYRGIYVGQIAPEFKLPRITENGVLGETVTLQSMKGKVLILDFWATWCAPCRSSLPVLEEMAQRYREQGLSIVSINLEGEELAGKARSAVNALAPSVLLFSDEGAVSELYQVTTIPHIIVIDRKGNVAWVHRGFDTTESLRNGLNEAIDPLL